MSCKCLIILLNRICFLFMISLGGRNNFVSGNNTCSTGVVTSVLGAFIFLYLVNTALVSPSYHVSVFDLEINTTIKLIVPPVLHRNKPRHADQLAQVTYVPVRSWTLVWRVLHLLREHGGHRHLCLRAHVSLLHLWPQTQENVQRLLSHLQKTDQRHYQDIPQHVKVDHLGNNRSGFRNMSSCTFITQ